MGEEFYKKKGVVEVSDLINEHGNDHSIVAQQDLVDKYTGIVSMLDTGAKLKIDQAHLETVIPAIGNY